MIRRATSTNQSRPGGRSLRAGPRTPDVTARHASRPLLLGHRQKGRHMARFSRRGRVVAALAGAVATIAVVLRRTGRHRTAGARGDQPVPGRQLGPLGRQLHRLPLVLAGLSSTDSYSTVQAKADAIYAGFQGNLGANTVRLPINTYTVGTAWWNSYTGAIDAATARGMKVDPVLLGRRQGVHRRPPHRHRRLQHHVEHRVAKYAANSWCTSSR